MQPKQGHTLIETLIVVALLTVILAALYSVFLTGNAIYNKNNVLMDISQQLRIAMKKITMETRESTTSTITNTDADSYRINFDTPNKTTVQYYRTNNQLIREYPSGQTHIIATNISRLVFTKVNQLLTVEIRARKTFLGINYDMTYVEKVRLRNE